MITKEPFVRFPVSWTFPDWFDVNEVNNGTLITNGWLYAVVDTDRRRLYYYGSH